MYSHGAMCFAAELETFCGPLGSHIGSFLESNWAQRVAFVHPFSEVLFFIFHHICFGIRGSDRAMVEYR